MNQIQQTLNLLAQHFNTYMQAIDFHIFCLIYSICFIILLKKIYEPVAYRPQHLQLMSPWQRWKQKIFHFILNIRFIQYFVDQKFNQKLDKIQLQLYNELNKERDTRKAMRIPQEGMSQDKIRKRIMEWINKQNAICGSGKVSGAIYTYDGDFKGGLNDFSSPFMYHNPMHLDTYREITRMESEILQMTGSMISNKSQIYGVVTSGGSQSLIMCLYAYRKYYSHRTKPNMQNISGNLSVIPVTTHAAIDKGCFYLNIQMRKVQLDDQYKVDLKHMQSLIDQNTIMLLGSYPNFPHGIIDPIKSIANLAKKYDVGLHVDACLGGFIAAFLPEHGKDLSLDLDGVTSISLDHHKYGLAPKGAAAIFFKTRQLRHCMYYINTDWKGGLYGTPSFPGSRSGFSSSGAWYSLIQTTKIGFIKNAKQIQNTTMIVNEGLKKIEGIKLFGNPDLCAFGFTSIDPKVSSFSLLEYLNKQFKWSVSVIHKPDGIRFTVTLANSQNARDNFVKNIQQAMKVLRKHPAKATTSSIVYGATSSLPITNMGKDLVKTIVRIMNKA